MLESATIRQQRRADGTFDIGRLLDAMLYYDRVNLILDPGSYGSILNELGLGETKALLSHPTLTVSLIPEISGIQNDNRNGVSVYRAVFIAFAGDEKRRIDPEDAIAAIHNMTKRNERWSDLKRGDVNATLRKVRKTKLSNIIGSEFVSQRIYKSLVYDIETVRLFLRSHAAKLGCAINEQALTRLQLDIVDVDGGLFLVPNLPPQVVFGDAARQDFQWSSILSVMRDYSIDLYVGQAYSSDVICAQEAAEIADARIDLSLRRAGQTDANIRAFERAVFNQAKLFGEAYNDGKLPIGGALNLIDRSRKMRSWTRGLPPDADILSEYQAELAREPILKSMPASIARFVLFGGGGALLSPALGLGLAAFDQFIVERFAKGWKPSIFVKNVREFIPAEG